MSRDYYANCIYTFQWFKLMNDIISGKESVSDLGIDILLNDIFKKTGINVSYERDIGDIAKKIRFEDFND